MSDTNKTVTKASNVYAFKNGFCLITRQFDIPPNNDGTPLELVELPSKPVHGTFSIQTTSNVKVSSIRTKKTRQSTEKKCTTIEQLILANADREKVQLLIQGLESNPIWLEGRIQTNQSDLKSTSSATTGSQMIIFEQEDNEIIVLPLKSIVSIRGKNLKTTLTEETTKNCLAINYKNESNSNGQGLMKYLTFGIVWVPSYELDLITSSQSNVKMLRLSLKCVLLNDIENLQVENLSCIVGHPNLSKYTGITDPVFNTNSAEKFLDELDALESRSAYSNSSKYSNNRFNLRSNRSNYVMVSSDDEEDDDEKPDSNEDFDLYQFQHVLLEQNEKISLPIFDMQVPYKDVYHCKIDPKKSSNAEEKSKSDHGEYIITPEVWHSVEFENKSGHSLTTAPVLITRDNHQFICQETLPFTLKNHPVFIHLTKAPGIRVAHDEKASDVHASAKHTSVKIFEQDYVKEQWDGTITVTNATQESVPIVLKIQLHGHIANYSTQPKVDAIQQGNFLVNQVHDIRWDIQLEPRQNKEIKYSRLFHRSVKSTYDDE